MAQLLKPGRANHLASTSSLQVLGEALPEPTQCLLAAVRSCISGWMRGWDIEPKASLLLTALSTRQTQAALQTAVAAQQAAMAAQQGVQAMGLQAAAAAAAAGQATTAAAAASTKADQVAKISLEARAAARASEKKVNLVGDLAKLWYAQPTASGATTQCSWARWAQGLGRKGDLGSVRVPAHLLCIRTQAASGQRPAC